MRSRTRGSLAFAAIASVVGLAACGGSEPAADTGAAAPEAVAASAPAAVETPALAGATPAPASDQFTPDEHPELAHLTEVTTESLAAGIASYVQSESERHDGKFTITDPVGNTSLDLSLASVHRDRLSRLADGRYFACADFEGADGHTYDIDIFMQPQSTGGLAPTDVIVHKEDGVARFNWVERNGTWVQEPVPAR